MIASCASEPDRKPIGDEEILRRFAAIEIGSLRSQVEIALGRPLLEAPEYVDQSPLEGRFRAWYLHTPPLPEWISPYMPGAIEVVYVRDRVVEKTLSPQVRR
jgi:hypothetical protein